MNDGGIGGIGRADFAGLRGVLSDLAARAAAEILMHYHSGAPVDVESKPDDTPVTAADLAAHRLLVEGLAPLGLPVLSEESVAEAMARHRWSAFWMVDPLDGTREFLEGTGEFSVNIALIEAHRATLGLIAIPATGEVYCGGAGLGAWREANGSWGAIRSRPVPEAGPLVVYTSRRHRGDRLEHCLATLREQGLSLERRYCGSAIKFCRLAEGVADFYPRFSPCSEWDTAAGQALLEGAGGAVLSVDGEPLRYNARKTLQSPPFLALADPDHQLWSNLR